MTAEEFTSQVLQDLRREFFQAATEKQFFQQVPVLKQAICHPEDDRRADDQQQVCIVDTSAGAITIPAPVSS